VYSASDVQRPM